MLFLQIILGFIIEGCLGIQAKTIKKIIRYVAPDFLDGLFDIKPCVRKLKYLGDCCDEDECDIEGGDFKVGQVYESIDFTGTAYAIKRSAVFRESKGQGQVAGHSG